MYRYWAHKET